MFKRFWSIGLVLLMFSSFAKAGDFFSDPTYDGKYHWTTAYGIQHAAAQLAIQEGAEAAKRLGGPEWLPKATGVLGCAGWFLTENDPFKNLDSVLDWVSPCAISLFYNPGWWYNYNKQEGFVLMPDDKGLKVMFRKPFK